MKKILSSSIALAVIFNLAHAQESKKDIWSSGAYKMTDTIPRIIYVQSTSRDSADIKYNGEKYALDGTLTWKSEKIKTFDLKTFTLELEPDYKPCLISLVDLIKKYVKINSDYIVYKIDDKLVKREPSEIIVDEQNIMSISVEPIKSNKGLDDIFIITLKRRSEENVKDANTIRIR